MRSKAIGTVVAVLLMVLMVLPADAADPQGGIHILKTDIFGKALPGACYQIAREATSSELQDSSVPKRLLKAGEETLTVVYPSFWDSRGMAGGKKTEVETASDGTAAMYGLPYGTYYLVESKAPEGYDRMTEPIRVTVNKYSHLTAADDVRDDADTVIDNTLHIVTIRYGLPDTGDTAFLSVPTAFAGLLVSLGLLSWLLYLRKRYGL